MPWYEQGQLDEWKAAQQPDEGAVRRSMLWVLEAVAHLHGNKVVHCDVKPENILGTAGCTAFRARTAHHVTQRLGHAVLSRLHSV
ncbi:hypothetical protein CYMTET_32906 [Cymbomonas tetramitiformis]|uniref:Protein kinase domain-containing protein n=1 Tax=Cymbomonas tetramitiformis TaxID=36881 RepID=A0AAE0FEG8_9CHLO|nr:hypothetical protein CYMTET_32906 [Cymbomonas tetramitiformis]